MSDAFSIVDGVLNFSSFFTVTLGIIVLFVGRRINSCSRLLQEFSIPEPVTGGIFFSIFISLLFVFTNIEIQFDLTARDVLLVYFFTTIGINSSLKDLRSGGKPLVILLCITIAYMMIQNVTGITIAQLFGQSPAVGILGGSVSLIGGHGTAIAWAPGIGSDYGVSNAMEIGIACATFGLILASLMGGPIAKYLINRHGLKASQEEQEAAMQSQNSLEKGITSF
ncbi:MAG: sodium/glutamate symporter, partial [Shewanella sp.]